MISFRAILVGTVTIVAVSAADAGLSDHAKRDTHVDENVVAPLALRWAPNWLVRSLSRAVADATDPRDRHGSH